MKYLQVLSWCIFITGAAQAQPAERAMGGSRMDYVSDLQSIPGGAIALGTTKSFGAGSSDIYLIKTDGAGAVQWTRTYGGSNDEVASAVIATADAGFVFIGYSSDTIGKYIVMTRTDSLGVIRWSRSYRRATEDVALSLAASSDGGFLIGGATLINQAFNNDAYLIKTDSNGLIQWTRTFGDIHDDGVSQIVSMTGGRYLVSGWMYSNASRKQGFYLMELDSSGNTRWAKAYAGNTGHLSISALSLDSSGSIFLSGSNFLAASGVQACLIKADSIGSIQWIKTYTAREFAACYGMCTTSNGFMLCGVVADAAQAYRDGLLLQVDREGTLLKSVSFGGRDAEQVARVRAQASGAFLLGGNTTSYGRTDGDCYFVATDTSLIQACLHEEPTIMDTTDVIALAANFSSGTGAQPGQGLSVSGSGGRDTLLCSGTLQIVPVQHMTTEVVVWPNPFHGKFIVMVRGSGYRIAVYDFLGRLLHRSFLQAGTSEIKLGAKPEGIYYYQIYQDDKPVQRAALMLQY